MIEGPDARAFAHAQFSSKVTSLEAGGWQFSAWLGPQGRVRAFFHLIRLAKDTYLLLLRGGTAASMAEALQPFVFRSKVSISAQLPRNLSAGAALPTHAVLTEDDVICLGCDTYSMQIAESIVDDDNTWLAPQLRLGWPWLPESALDELLPAALSLQRLQAVAVDKGCYPGQEIVARLHFRGGHKRHLCSGTLSQPRNPGEILRIEGNDVGRVLDVITEDAGNEALVVLNDDVAIQAREEWLDLFDDKTVKMRITTSWPA
ncbi:MAG: folate-binding protein [Rhodanobacter sp.]